MPSSDETEQFSVFKKLKKSLRVSVTVYGNRILRYIDGPEEILIDKFAQVQYVVVKFFCPFLTFVRKQL